MCRSYKYTTLPKLVHKIRDISDTWRGQPKQKGVVLLVKSMDYRSQPHNTTEKVYPISNNHNFFLTSVQVNLVPNC